MTDAVTKRRRAKGIVFDLDGTLYDQAKLRRRMAHMMALHFLARPREVGDVRIVWAYRHEAERLSRLETDGIKETLRTNVARRCKTAPSRVDRVIETWMFERPLAHLRQCLYPGVDNFFRQFRLAGGRIGVLSDYPVEKKMEALGLEVDAMRSAFDPAINRFKPHSRGLAVLLDDLALTASDCVFVGDRSERDGVCAARLGLPFFLRQDTPKANTISDVVGAVFQDYSELGELVFAT